MQIPQRKQGRLEDIVGAILDGQQEIVSYAGASQYQDAKGMGTGASSCGLAALNCARIVFRIYQALKPSPHSSSADDARRLLSGILCRQTVDVSIGILMPSHARHNYIIDYFIGNYIHMFTLA